MQELAPSWSLAKVVMAIQALRGVALIAAITLVAEILKLPSLRQSAPAHGLPRSDPERTIFWSKDIAWRNHQGGEHTRQTYLGGERLDLSSAGADRGPNPESATRACRRRSRTLPGRPKFGYAPSFGKLRIAAFVWAIATNEHVRLAPSRPSRQPSPLPSPSKAALTAVPWFRRTRFVNVSPQPMAILTAVRQILPLSRCPNLPRPRWLAPPARRNGLSNPRPAL